MEDVVNHNEFNKACGGFMYRIWSRPANIQLGKPTIVFINPQTGVAQVATSEHDSPPPGFIKQELKGPIERSKFEQTQNAINAQEDAIYNENLRINREEARERTLKGIDENIREDAAKSDNPAETVRLMQAAKEYIKKKPTMKKKRQTNFVLDVNHKDKSNLV